MESELRKKTFTQVIFKILKGMAWDMKKQKKKLMLVNFKKIDVMAKVSL